MRDQRLPQTLILDPDTGFDTIERTLSILGWERKTGASADSLLPGEPEVASWTWQGHKPYVIYTYNPVVHLRVLDVANLPPVFRRALCDLLPWLNEEAVDHLFFDQDPRRRLLGLWAARETERTDLAGQAERLTYDPDSTVAEEARTVAAKLKRIGEARLETLAQLQILCQAAPELIRKLDHPDVVASLKPSLEDCELLFDRQVAQAAHQAAAEAHEDNLCLSPIEPNVVIDVTASPAGLLRWSNEISDKFPGGYRDIAGWMAPKNIWLSWTMSDPGGSRVRYDGLAWLGDRWVWLPKVYRRLAPLCLSGRGAGTPTH
jgi:hypothetical protein